ncbi:DUF732 domain-containing protein [Mycolicibacterium grossiae]|uniref:DUF732 domain-containing protein n=1 Tax=Mycolicibacterium grossiae TaxID=1552759 RepID=A0A1E8PYU7_9MYCO|nr:DUF732 domain-containing protein [Mycolicibacterium grossiae]OFJ51351.1 hypothetical protein BEL07_23200 [Mycolicibacterium grossiae]
MHLLSLATRGALLTAGVATAALLAAGPAAADPTGDAFLDAVNQAGVGLPGAANPGDAVALGQSVCPMLAEPGQTTADAAAKVADAAGMSLGPATMFTGMAISAFCPGVVAKLGAGESPLPFGLFGF